MNITVRVVFAVDDGVVENAPFWKETVLDAGGADAQPELVKQKRTPQPGRT
jgi:hypothetical protein